MPRIQTVLATALMVAGSCSADSVLLRNGKTITGASVVMNAQEVTIFRCGATEKYPRVGVQSVDFTAADPGQSCGAPLNNAPEFPAGAAMEVRLLDYVDSSREPPGQTFRGALESAVTVDGRVIASAGARVILRLQRVPGELGLDAQTLEIVAVQMEKKWVSIQPVAKSIARSVSEAEVLEKANRMDVVARGLQVVVPAKTRLKFTWKERVRFVPEIE